MLLLLVFIITFVACIYILVVELDWIFDVDVLWKVKEKVRVLVYGNQLGIYRPERPKRSYANRTGAYKTGAFKRINKQ